MLSTLSLMLGRQRRTLRRLGALCLVWMGVHAAADAFDDVAYALLDAMDLWFDTTSHAALMQLANTGWLTEGWATSAANDASEWMDLSEKSWLSLRLALLAELMLDVLLFDLVWGQRDDTERDLKLNARRLLATLTPMDAEVLLVVPAMGVLVVSGALLPCLALESVARSGMARITDAPWATNAAALTGILSSLLLLVRFAPDLLEGALHRTRVHADAFSDRLTVWLAQPSPSTLRWMSRAPTLLPLARRAWAQLRRRLRGSVFIVVTLSLGLMGLLAHDIDGLLTRLWSWP